MTFEDAFAFVATLHADTMARSLGISQRLWDQWRDAEGLESCSVFGITPREAATIWRRDFWNRCGSVTLTEANRPGLAFLVFDAAAECEDPLGPRRYVQAVVGTTCDGLWADDTLAAVSLWSDAALCAEFQRLRALAARVRAGEAQHRVTLTKAGLHGGALPRTGSWNADEYRAALKRLRKGAKKVGIAHDPPYRKEAA